MYETPHRRRNPLTGEWVLVSPQRGARPWLGQVEKSPPQHLPTYDPTCYLCPDNARAEGVRNPKYTGTFVFENDFPSLLSTETIPEESSETGLLAAWPERGICKVICFSPRHDLTLPELDLSMIEEVVSTWAQDSERLGQMPFIQNVQIFENKGAVMGCSNPHPHSQIWAQSELPNEEQKELAAQQEYQALHGRALLADVLAEEQARNERIVFENEHFAAIVPFWAVWPFEVLLLAKRSTPYLAGLRAMERTSLAQALKEVTTRYDNLFESSFPYSMGFHQAPYDGKAHPEWVLHAHFYPPLLRSATVKKFMVGYEMLAMPQRDITPEAAAERLRSLSGVHYKMAEAKG